MATTCDVSSALVSRTNTGDRSRFTVNDVNFTKIHSDGFGNLTCVYSTRMLYNSKRACSITAPSFHKTYLVKLPCIISCAHIIPFYTLRS